MAYIKAISYYLPAQNLTNEIIHERFPEWSVEKISSKTGIYSRPLAGREEFSSDLAFQAGSLLFEEHGIDRQSIDFVLLCTQSPDYFLPTTACILQERLGLRKSTGALDFNLGCSGYVYGLALAKGLVDARMAKNVLLLTAETYSKYIHARDKSNLTIFGDAAAATLIGADAPGGRIENFVFGTDGAGANNLIVKQGGTRHPIDPESRDTVDEFGNVRNDRNLYMNGSAIFNFTLEAVPPLVEDTLQKNSLKKEDVSLFIFHQANLYLLNHLKKKIGIENDKFYIHLKTCANTVSSTVPIAMYEARKEGAIKEGTCLLIAGFGVGYSWAGGIIKY